MANTAIDNLTELTSPDTGGADVLAIVDLTSPENVRFMCGRM